MPVDGAAPGRGRPRRPTLRYWQLPWLQTPEQQLRSTLHERPESLQSSATSPLISLAAGTEAACARVAPTERARAASVRITLMCRGMFLGPFEVWQSRPPTTGRTGRGEPPCLRSGGRGGRGALRSFSSQSLRTASPKRVSIGRSSDQDLARATATP